ncbi:ketoacyl-synt-domain-containing protein [Lojkania enalia]|uniref:Ketoacyl-synt-domain-containing protein n=1 Tax=Lojkania enalia TaxID=147567 RepID=A0A9P4MZY4_9PLEO|nr:ketoacyl-synt-domain-containing protein [Didymosphaeria enalia]
MNKENSTPIAIVGISCRFPGGVNSPQKLWELLQEGTNTWSHVPLDRYNESAFHHPDPDDTNGSHNHSGGHFLTQDIRDFDQNFFNITPQEAAAMDAQQRILLETVYEAFESGGQRQDEIRESATSVYVAMFTRDYDRNIYKDTLDIPRYQATGTGDAILANRVSHVFDLRGPSITLDTGCSGGMVAIHQACLSLSLGESDMAVVGAANLIISPDQQVGMSNLHMLSTDGRSYPFDHRGSGYGRGEGFATFILKRLESAIAAKDPIRAIILGSAVNQDGRTIAGITYPNSAAQADLGRRLLQRLGLDPLSVAYVEAHGTGTIAGDREEIDALTEVFCKNRKTPLYVGSIKSNIGHLECTSGLAGLMKSILILEHRQIPANANFVLEKNGLRLSDRNIAIPTVLRSWPQSVRPRVSVNSFGYGGTNAHVVLESAPKANPPHPSPNLAAGVVPRLFVLSAKSQVSLTSTILQHRAWVLSQGASLSLSSLSYTLCTRRTSHPWRFSCVANDHQGLFDQLAHTVGLHNSSLNSKDTPISFVFTGQGAQWPGMGRELLLNESSSVFRASMHRSRDILRSFGAAWDLIDEILHENDKSRIHLAEIAQPATTAIQIALIDLLGEMEIHPSTVIGHSSGEIAAAYAAGLISQSTALRISYFRGLTPGISQKKGYPKGAMLVVGLDEETASKHIARITKGIVSIACLNSPENTTISGDEDAIDELAVILSSKDIFARKLRVDTAYHSHHMLAAAEEYKDLIGSVGIENQKNPIKLFSTVSASEKCGFVDADYWVDNLVSKVRFQESMERLCRAETTHRQIFIEIGPHSALAGPIRQCIAKMSDPIEFDYLSPLQRGKNAVQSLLEVSGRLFELGKQVDFSTLSSFDPETQTSSVLHDLPSYCWDHTEKHWHESRLSRDHRLRKHPYHDLLGLRSPEAASLEPRWRHMISVATLPWLADHVVDGLVVFPGSGYLCMAIEAISQLVQEAFPNRRVRQTTLKDVEFLKALLVPDPPQRTEAQLSFTPVDSNKDKSDRLHYHFRVAAYTHDHTWDEHCRGFVEVDLAIEHEFGADNGCCLERENEPMKAKKVSSEEVYQHLRMHGNAYGPAFRGVQSILMDGGRAIANVAIPNVAETMPAGFIQPHTIHPTTLDILMHSSLPLASQKLGPGSIMPVRIDELIVSTNLNNAAGAIMFVNVDIVSTNSRTARGDIDVFNDRSLTPSLCISGVELRLLKTTSSVKGNQLDIRNICWKMSWGLDVDFMSSQDFIKPKHQNKASHSLQAKVQILNQVTTFYLDRCLGLIHNGKLKITDEYHLLFEWMLRQTGTSGPNYLLRDASEPSSRPSIPNIPQFTEMELLVRIGDQLPAIVSGTVNALQLVVEDGLLYKAYREDSSTLDYDILRQYVKHLGFKKSKLRVLEIGAGTGGATLPFLQTMKEAGFSLEVYDFTDISTGFFDRAASMLSEYSVNYRKLDIEKDPVHQGFELLSYDVVLASNCLHVTSRIKTTLQNARSLLKPDGRLVIIELVNAQPFHHITFGTLPGYWKGSTDGRPDGPFMNVDRWRQVLNDTSMELQLSVKDGELEHLNSLMVARPRDDTIPEFAHPVQILPINRAQHGLASMLLVVLKDWRISAAVEEFDFGLDDDRAIKIILDNGKCPLLSDVAPERFEKLCAMLRRQSRVMWISASDDSISSANPVKHLITGLGRTAHAENDELRLVTVDVQQNLDGTDLKLLEFLRNCLYRSFFQPNAYSEREFIFRDDMIHIPRLLANNTMNQWVSRTQQNIHLGQSDFTTQPLVLSHDEVSGVPGPIFVADEAHMHRATLSENEIEIQVRAVGVPLNGFDSKYHEYSGTIVSLGSNVTDFNIGDRVMAVGTSPCASRPRICACHAQQIPTQMSYTIAAALPLALMTACYVLFDLVDISPTQRLLIQGIPGVVGQALLLIARHRGAEVVVLASDQSEAYYLKEQLLIPAECIIYNSPLSRERAKRLLCPSRKLDTIITCNTLDIPTHVVAALEPFGKVINLQSSVKKSASLRHRYQLPPNITLHSFDFDAFLGAKPQKAAELLKQAAHLISTDSLPLSELPFTIENVADIRDVIRRARSDKYSRDTVLEVKEGSMVSVLGFKELEPGLDSAATFVIAGGLGDLGQRILSHLAKKGAKHLVTLSRRSLEGDRLHLAASIRVFKKDCMIHHIQCDIAREDELRAAAATMKSMGLPPIKGVIQSAMVLQDRTLDSMTVQDFRVPLEPKMKGTLNLQRVFGEMDLDFFIMLSSAANIAGTSGQGNYNAGNAVQDAFAHSVNSKRCHYLTFSPGMIEGADVLHGDEVRVKALHRSGFTPIQRDELDKMIEYLLSSAAHADRCSLIVAGFDSRSLSHAVSTNSNVRSPMFTHALGSAVTEAKQETVSKEESFTNILQTSSPEDTLTYTTTAVSKKLASLISVDVEAMDLDKPISNFGLDSLIAIELRNFIKREFQASLKTLEILDEQNIRTLAKKIVSRSQVATEA